jgi:hypothetical protein
MSASPVRSARRTALAATAVATAAVCGVLLAPTAADAAPSVPPLTVAVGDVSHNAIGRGQGAQTMTLTVSNPADAAQDFGGLVFGRPDGPSPILGSQILFQVAPVTAPATDVLVSQQDDNAMAEFYPHGGKLVDTFAVPAHSSISWKMTLGFRQDYPLNDDGITLEFAAGGHSENVRFDLPPAQADGKLTGTLGPKPSVAPGRPGRTWYDVADSAGGAFQSPLRTRVSAPTGPAGLGLQLLSGGRWVDAKAQGTGQWLLPDIPKGFTRGGTRHYDLRFTVPAGRGTGKARDVQMQVTTALASGNITPMADLISTLHYDPTPVVATTPTATPSPAATPSATASAAAPAAPTATATNAPSADAELAHTGSDDAGLLAGLAALFAAAGALVVLSARRRRNAA